MKFYRTLAISAFTLLAAHVANATTYYDTITGVDPSSTIYLTDSLQGNSFTAATPDFTAVQLLLALSTPDTTGLADVYLVTNLADFIANPGSTTGQLIGTVYDSELSVDGSVKTFFMSTSLASGDQTYWIFLADTDTSSISWGVDLVDSGQSIYSSSTGVQSTADAGDHQQQQERV